jgi:hypothetical protein
MEAAYSSENMVSIPHITLCPNNLNTATWKLTTLNTDMNDLYVGVRQSNAIEELLQTDVTVYS